MTQKEVYNWIRESLQKSKPVHWTDKVHPVIVWSVFTVLMLIGCVVSYFLSLIISSLIYQQL
jgi:hypothetical protein